MASQTASTIWKRILLFPLTRFVLSLLALWLGYLLHLGVSQLLSLPPEARQIPFVLALVGAYIGYVRLVERRPTRELSWREAPRELGLGTAVGAGLVAAVVLGLWAAGSYQVAGLNSWTVAAMPIVTMAVVSIWEELVFRGIVFRLMEEGLGSWVALLASAALFGLVHLGNEDATIVGALTIAATAGFLLAGVYMLTRRLWIAIGMHFAVNAAQGPILGLPVSGHDNVGWVQSRTEGPLLLTGGDFGIEASLLLAVLGVALAVYILKAAHARGQFVRPLWSSPDRSLDDGGILGEMR